MGKTILTRKITGNHEIGTNNYGKYTKLVDDSLNYFHNKAEIK